jgi:hypothetical protein
VVRLDDDAEIYQGSKPAIAVDRWGNAYVVWVDTRNNHPDIYFSFRPAGESWNLNVKVNDDDGSVLQHWPSIGVDCAGNAHAVWTDRRNGAYDIYSSYRPAGGTWGPDTRVTDDAWSRMQGSPSVAVDCAGNAYAVWWDERRGPDHGDGDIFFSYRPVGGGWGTNVRVNDDCPGTVQSDPSIAVDLCGNAYAVWVDRRLWEGADIFSSYLPAGGSWSVNARVDDAPSEADSYHPSIAAGPCGVAFAVWMDRRNSDNDIYSSYRGADGVWRPNLRVNDDTGDASQKYPFAAADVHGNAYAVWEDDRNDNYDSYFSLYRPYELTRLFMPLAAR